MARHHDSGVHVPPEMKAFGAVKVVASYTTHENGARASRIKCIDPRATASPTYLSVHAGKILQRITHFNKIAKAKIIYLFMDIVNYAICSTYQSTTLGRKHASIIHYN